MLSNNLKVFIWLFDFSIKTNPNEALPREDYINCLQTAMLHYEWSSINLVNLNHTSKTILYLPTCRIPSEVCKSGCEPAVNFVQSQLTLRGLDHCLHGVTTKMVSKNFCFEIEKFAKIARNVVEGCLIFLSFY